MKHCRIRVAALVMALALFLCCTSASAVETRANPYISVCSGYIYPTGNGGMDIYFSVTGTKRMTKIGANVINVYDSNGTLKKSFDCTSAAYSNMMGYDRTYYGSHVSWQGVPGTTYYAIICFAAVYQGTSYSYVDYVTGSKTV